MKINGIDIDATALPERSAPRLWGPICSMEADGPHARMAETPFGAWVLYEDVKHLLPTREK